MANEFKHDSVGTQLTQAEWEAVGGHVFDSQATGDIVYASSTSQLSRLGIGSTGAVLTVTGGIPAWDTTWTPTGHLIPATDDSYDLGSSSAAWQDLFLEGDITLTDAGTIATSAGALTITSAAAATWSTSAGALTITSAAALNLNPTAGSAIVLDSTINVDAGVVTGATSITSTAFVGTLSTAAQTNITSLGTLTALTVDDVAIDGKVVTMTGSASDTAVFTAGTNGTLSIVTTDAAAAAANIQITADGTVDIDSAGVLTLDSGAAINIEPASGSAILLDGTISIDAGVVTGATSITSTAFVGDITGDVTGNTDTFTASANNSTNETVYPVFVDGATGTQGAETDTGLTYNPSSGVLTATQFTGALTGAVTGNADTATLATTVTITDNESTNESNAIIFTAGGDVDGGNLGLESDGTLTYNPSTGKITATGFIGTLTGTADTATVATTVTITDNESTNEDNAIIFTAGGDVDGGNIGLESDGTMTYNPSTGKITATGFIGALTGDASGSAATVTGGTQTAITTLANLTTSGALNAGSITSGFGNIDNGSSTLDTGALDASTGTFSGVLKTDDTTNATSTTDGSLQTDGGLSVALDGIFGDDVTLITDSAVLNLGIGSDVSLTHDGTTGGTLSGTPMTIDSLGASALANDTYTGIVLGFISNEAIAIGNAVYIHTTDGRIGVADANALATMPAIGVAVTATGSAGNAVKVLTHGIYNDSDGFGGDLTEAATMYLGETTGAVTATIPDADGDFVQIMGIACGPRDVFINPSLDIIERA